MLIPLETQAELVREASRAPSVHNVQPARWRFTADDGVELWRAVGRELPVGDPTGHDLAASLGAAWEGMSIALSRVGFRLGDPAHVVGSTPVDDAVLVARGRIERGATPDLLAAHVFARRSHRGRFLSPTPASCDALQRLAAEDAVIVTDPAELAAIAELHDRATWHFESNAAYHAELWSWLRLSPRDPRWARDGLNADCLALSPIERAAARLLLAPRIFALLRRLGVARHVVSEAAQVRSATGVVLFAPLRTMSPFDVGRRFYRLWLELTATGLHAAPMSASSDWSESRDTITTRYAIPAERRLANVLRAGAAHGVAESARLPKEKLGIRN